MMMCLGVFLSGSNFFGILWASWKSISFAGLEKLSFIIFSHKFSISCSSSSPSGTPVIQILEHLKLSHSFPSLFSFFWILVSSLCSSWMFTSYFCSKLLIWVLVSLTSLLFPWIFSFISLWVSFTCSFILQLSQKLNQFCEHFDY